MSTPILDRLNARIAAEPALDHLDTLFSDLQDARDAIANAVEENTKLKDMLSAPQSPSTEPGATVSSSKIEEALAFLKEAKERLAVNSPSSAGDNIDKAIRLLG